MQFYKLFQELLETWANKNHYEATITKNSIKCKHLDPTQSES
jgi:hypothetical protein